MALQPGTKLGTYEILAAIGAGGMGEVYRARDTKLGREVAIKTLPSAVANDSEKISRFAREARLLAALNHPNIATLHGLEDSEGVHFLVMELVEGETLAERIARGPIPIDEALPLLKQLVSGLEAAHEKGVIHRDLKPPNIKISEDGNLKILDFGLAKAFSADETPGNEMSQSPTLTRGTATGAIMGTAAYMSPEQARGKFVDKRSDIWAFGAVLYEMLTGRQVFAGNDASEIIAGVIKSEPSWERAPDDLPPTWLRVLKRCLEKEPKERVRDIGDVRLALQGAFDTPAPQPIEASRTTSVLPWAIAAVAALIAIVSIASRNPAPRTLPPARFAIPAHGELPPRVGTLMALSPDGQELVYHAITEDGARLYRRSMNQLEPVPFPGTEGGRNPFFSPDGQWMGYTGVEGRLKKVSLQGRLPTPLCDCIAGTAAWGPDGTIVFTDGVTYGLMRVSSAGGIPEPVTRLERDESLHSHPTFLPNGDTVLFSISSGSLNTAQIAAVTVSTGKRKPLAEGLFPRYLPTGHLIFARAGGSLWAVPFDGDRVEMIGEPVLVMEGVRIEGGGSVQFSVAGAGIAVFIPSDAGGAEPMLVRIDRDGHEAPLNVPPLSFSSVQFSPDGKRIAVAVEGRETWEHVWVYDTVLKTILQLNFDVRGDNFPIWTPDAQRVVFFTYREGRSEFLSKLADRTGQPEHLTTLSNDAGVGRPWSITSDGRTLLYQEVNRETGWDVGTVSLEGESLPQQLLATESGETHPQISRDGNWLAYVSDESGQNEVYVSPFPNPSDGKWRVSHGGGAQPVWAPDGGELFYLRGSSLLAVSIDTTPTFAASNPRVLFSGPYRQSGPNRGHTYDVAPDGQSFLMIREAENDGAASEFIVIQNWLDELERLVPAR